MLPFFRMCRLFSPTVQQQTLFFLESALLLDSWRMDPVFGTGTGWTFCYIQMAWQLRDNDLFWIYVFVCFGGCWMLLFSPRKSTFTPMIWLIWEKWSMGHFFNGSFKRPIPPVRTEKASSWKTLPGNFTGQRNATVGYIQNTIESEVCGVPCRNWSMCRCPMQSGPTWDKFTVSNMQKYIN